MEPLSRPFHRNQASSATLSKKHSNANSFSAYDDVFAATPKFGAPAHSSRIEDYGEIFGGSQASRPCSIPILDLSVLDESKVSDDARGSKLEYSKIFGGFSDEDIAVSYEEMFAKPKEAKQFSDKARTPAKRASQSDGSDRLNPHKEEALQYEVPNQSSEGKKQFSMSYHKTSQGTNDGTNGTTRIAQLRAVPGFTCFIDENHATKSDAISPSEVYRNLTKKQTSDGTGKLENQSNKDKFKSIDKATEPKTHPSQMSASSSLPGNSVSNRSKPKMPMDSKFKVPKTDASRAGPGYSSPPLSDDELDVNSAAAASAAALRKALEKAQASIRIAKEFMERKKDCPQRFSKPSSKDGLDVKNKREDKFTTEASRMREKIGKEACESADIVLQVFNKAEREKARRSGKVAPDHKEAQEIFTVNEVGGETNGNKLESAEDCEALGRISDLANRPECRTATLACEHAYDGNNIMLSVDAHGCRRKEMEIGEENLKLTDENGRSVDEEAQKLEDMDGTLNTVETEGCRRKEIEIDQEILEQLHENGKKVDEEAQKLEDLEAKLSTVKMAQEWEQHIYRLNTAQEVHEQENERAGGSQENDETEKQKSSNAQEKCEKELEKSLEQNKNEEFETQAVNNNSEERHDTTQECMENEKLEEILEKEQNKKSLKDVHAGEESENRPKKICEEEEFKKSLQQSSLWVDHERTCGAESIETQNDAHVREDNEKRLHKFHELHILNRRLNGTPDGEECDDRQEDDSYWDKEEEVLVEACEHKETQSIQRETEGYETTEVNLEAVEETMYPDAESASTSEDAHKHKQNDNDLYWEEEERISYVSQSSCEYKIDEIGLEAVEVAQEVGEKEVFKTSGLAGGAVEDLESENKTKDANEALLSDDNPTDIGLTETNYRPKETNHNEEELQLFSNLGSDIKISVSESVDGEKRVENEVAFEVEEVQSTFDTAYEEGQSVEMGKQMEASQSYRVFEVEEKMIGIDEDIKISQITNNNEETKQTEEKEVMGKEHLTKNDEANKREREREKDRMAVERAIREARERAFIEARERAERAAVERATAEARKRVMAEAREKLEKASAATKSSAEKASIEAKLRAERAAVERATVEARERALEKALSQKSTSGARDQAERFVAEKLSGVSRDNGMRQSFPSSKLDETNGEPVQRCKAKLERHQRTMERAAKALAEKNMRDLLAQKEQAERNRLAETLDAEVKRWSSGKEGNLRALLSTLQYILGPDSGWQPISLTDIITTSAVKKAYRKATLHVHPDKLQQRGAGIQQKYICEKVFDLLKAAWNKFNSEER